MSNPDKRLARENAKLRAAQWDREMSRAARLEARDRAYAAALAANGITAERVEYRPDGTIVRWRGPVCVCPSQVQCSARDGLSPQSNFMPTDTPPPALADLIRDVCKGHNHKSCRKRAKPCA